MITIEIVRLHISQYLEMVIRTNEVIDLEDLLSVPTIGRR